MHGALYAADDLAQVGLRRLLSPVIKRVYTGRASDAHIRVQIAVGLVPIDLDTSVPLCLIVSELTAAAAAHLAEDAVGGATIEYTIEVTGNQQEMTVSIGCLASAGGRPVASPGRA